MKRNPYSPAIGHLTADAESAGSDDSGWPRGHIESLCRAATMLELAPELLRLAAWTAEFIAAGEMDGPTERRINRLRALIARAKARVRKGD